MKCKVCGSYISGGDVIGEDCLCPDCAAKYKKLAKIKCNKCNKIIGTVLPGKTDSGFVINPGSILHVNECPKCNPNIKETVIQEIKVYNKFIRKGGIIINGR